MAVDNDGEYKGNGDNEDNIMNAVEFDDNNGMPLEDWDRVMKALGYVRFTADSEIVDNEKEVWDPAALDSVKRMGLTHATTTLVPRTAGLQIITIKSQESGYDTKSFTIPAGYKATAFKASYDFSAAKPGIGEYMQVSLQKTSDNFGGSDTTLWSTRLMGQNWGSNSGTTKTEGSLDNLVLTPGSYSFTARRQQTSPSNQAVPIPATLTYTVSG
jgi:hypothetical protein